LVILIVEDDELLQALVQDALSDGGFKTEVISSGQEAIKSLERDNTNHRALITDVNLQGISLDGMSPSVPDNSSHICRCST
jgi:DNA-binding response OmpR family regulator